MIRSEKYLLTTNIGDREKKQVWDSSRPLGIGFPFKWVVERTEDGVRVRYLGDAEGASVAEARQVSVGDAEIRNGDAFDLPVTPNSDGVRGNPRMRIQLVNNIRPPYLQKQAPRADGSARPFQLFSFCGIQRQMVDCDQVHGAYVAHFRGKPVFAAYQNAEGIQIKPLLSGIFIKLKGGPAIPAYPNETLQLASHKIPLATIVRGNYWWKFNYVQLPDAPSLEEDENRPRGGTDKWFFGIIGILGAAFLLLLGAVLIMPTQIAEIDQQKKEEEKEKPPVVTFHSKLKVAKKMSQSKTPQEAGGAGSPAIGPKMKAANAEASAAPAQKIVQNPSKKPAAPLAAAPAVTPEKSEVHKHAAGPMAERPSHDVAKLAKSMGERKPALPHHSDIHNNDFLPPVKTAPVKSLPPAPPAPTAAEIAAKKSSAAMARQASILRAAMMGAQSLADKGNVMDTAADGDPNNAGRGLLKAPMVGDMAPTEIRSQYAGTGRAVSGFGGGVGNTSPDGTGGGGGGKEGIGYGSGKRAGVGGQGNSLVSVEGSGYTVAEGLTKEEVGQVIHSHMSEVRYCHEQSLLANPSTQGKLVLEFTINAGGRVESVSQQNSTVQEATLPPCVIRRLRTWQFPHPKGGVTVTVDYPFLFRTLGRE